MALLKLFVVATERRFMNATAENFTELPAIVTNATKAETVSASPSTPTVEVWLVDDNDQFRALIADLLGRKEGIECARQFRSPDALLSALASSTGPDVILLDIEMGAQSGLDAVRPVKSLSRSTHVLMFTTCYDPASYERAINDGATDYLLKTEPLETLVERIRHPGTKTSSMRRRPRFASTRPSLATVSPATKPNRKSPRPLARTLQILRSFWN
jgi:DNA-binding NarL/FixJ family response regulator